MQEIKNEWVDKSYTLAGWITADNMQFMYEGKSVAFIDKDGNLNIRGELIELSSPEKLHLVHDNDDRMMIWPHPHVFYDGKKVNYIPISDVNSNINVTYPACFWNDKDFYVWGKLETNVAGTPGEMIRFSPFELDNYGIYTKTSIRGDVKKVGLENEPKTKTEQTTV